MLSYLSRIIFGFFFFSLTQAACIPEPNPKSSSRVQEDGLALLLKAASTCPLDVLALRRLFLEQGLKIETTMVANEGFHNVSSGSYSFFELVSGANQNLVIKPGDLYFGHFSSLSEEGILTLDQSPANKKLMIELLAWDDKKGVFNFYELRGDGQRGHWFFRGDSWDIYLDNQNLHRQKDKNKPQFGTRLRCSGCHSLGGPIMKELTQPHNDWWQSHRPLLLTGFSMEEALSGLVRQTQSAEVLAQEVREGTARLFSNKSFEHQLSSLSLQELLRPLFCPVELNFKSDTRAFNTDESFIEIPVEFFIDERLLTKDYPRVIPVSRTVYERLLNEFDSSFPNTQEKESDHAWLIPVKAHSDRQFVDRLINNSIIDEKFVADVLAIDMTNPVFSERRCALLKYIPEQREHWRDLFLKNLQAASESEAQLLRNNMLNPHHSLAYYQEQARQYLDLCRFKSKNSTQLKAWYQLLLQRRSEISVSEISANPLGQILEPGFRVIFPTTNHHSTASTMNLDLQCTVIIGIN